MKDPDMVLLRDENGKSLPFEFPPDNLALYPRAVEFDRGEIGTIDNKHQADRVEFADMGMKNIRGQRGCDPEGEGPAPSSGFSLLS
jgi:hypothetical protein